MSVPSPQAAMTDVPGILVGHAHDATALTGCTVVLTTAGVVGGVDVRGGGPGTRETDLLHPVANVSEVHALAFCGGSAFGLAAATGVVDWLRERNYGYQTLITRVPLVPAAVIFDLGLGRSDRWPDAAMGYAACAAAGSAVVEGCVGAGIGASVGKLQGFVAAMKGGVGTTSAVLPDGTIVGALAVCNAIGDVVDETNQIIAGSRDLTSGGFIDTVQLLRQPHILEQLQQRQHNTAEGQNTTLGVVATNAALNKAQATKLAQMAQDGLARAIRPVHTPFDGDTVFALATGQQPAPHLMALGTLAADLLADAIRRAVRAAVPMGGLPAVTGNLDR